MKVDENVATPLSGLNCGYVCLQFMGVAISKIFLKLKEHFEESVI
jgi:hypothetical protein